MKKVIKNFLFIVLAVIILIVGGCFVILGIIDQQNKNYWKYAETSGGIETKYTALGEHEVSYECFFLRIPTVRKVCGGNQPATAGF